MLARHRVQPHSLSFFHSVVRYEAYRPGGVSHTAVCPPGHFHTNEHTKTAPRGGFCVGVLALYRLVAGVRHQCHVAGDFDGIGNTALVLVGQLAPLSGLNLELGGDELSQEGDIFVVDLREVVTVKDGAFHDSERVM